MKSISNEKMTLGYSWPW